LKDYQIWEIDFLYHFSPLTLKSARANQSAATPKDWLALFVAHQRSRRDKIEIVFPPVATAVQKEKAAKQRALPVGDALSMAAGHASRVAVLLNFQRGNLTTTRAAFNRNRAGASQAPGNRQSRRRHASSARRPKVITRSFSRSCGWPTRMSRWRRTRSHSRNTNNGRRQQSKPRRRLRQMRRRKRGNGA